MSRVRVFRCDTTDVCQTELAIIFAITVNCYLQLRVRQGEVPCSFRSFRHRIVSMYNRRGHDELFGHQASTFSRVGFHVGVSILGQGFRPTSRAVFRPTTSVDMHRPHCDHAGNDELTLFVQFFVLFSFLLLELATDGAFGGVFGLFLSQQGKF